jgi:hypothetical protein
MGRAWLLTGFCAGLVCLTGCDLADLGDWGGGAGRFTQDFHYAYPLKPGGRFSIENTNGAIEITGWSENSVEIAGTKYASTPELRDSIKIDVQASPDSIQVRTIRPSGRGNIGARYSIKVPRQTQLDRITSTNAGIRVIDVEGPARLRTTNGSVRTDRLRGALDAQTSNGAVDISDQEGSAVLHTTNGRIHAVNLKGSVAADTTNGGISVHIAQTEPDRPIRLGTTNGAIELELNQTSRNEVVCKTTNGGITLHLPASVNARLSASTTNSSIRSEFEAQATGSSSRKRLETNLGSGGPSIELSTVNGGIRILKQ